jgi:tetratricopeptide (TPR) repeat protein
VRSQASRFDAAAVQGKTDRALFAYEMAAALNPTCAEALNNIGVIHRERGNMERAAQCYTAALQIRPNFPQVLARDGAPGCTPGFFHKVKFQICQCSFRTEGWVDSVAAMVVETNHDVSNTMKRFAVRRV